MTSVRPIAFAGLAKELTISLLLPRRGRRTSAPVAKHLFNPRLRALRRDRAARTGPELFLFDRAFDDCLDRLRDFPRRFERALLVGCPTPEWPERLAEMASEIEVVDPGAIFASRAGGRQIEEDRHDFGERAFDLCIAIGTLDTVNDLPLAFNRLWHSLKADSPIIGAIAGGNSLPSLRTCLIEAERASGRAVARTHPRIDATSLARLLQSSGFAMPVVDIDRVKMSYADLASLVRDLRGMGQTSVLAQRSPAMSRSTAAAASTAFLSMGDGGRTEETVEILHFLAWKQ